MLFQYKYPEIVIRKDVHRDNTRLCGDDMEIAGELIVTVDCGYAPAVLRISTVSTLLGSEWIFTDAWEYCI